MTLARNYTHIMRAKKKKKEKKSYSSFPYPSLENLFGRQFFTLKREV